MILGVFFVCLFFGKKIMASIFFLGGGGGGGVVSFHFTRDFWGIQKQNNGKIHGKNSYYS